MSDRAVPFTLSVKLSFLARMERVLDLAQAQGIFRSPRGRTNKLALELLERALSDLESDFIATGLMLPATTPATPALPTASLAATDPTTRAAIRAAHDARSASLAQLGGGTHQAPAQPALEAGYRSTQAQASPFLSELDQATPTPLPAPDGIDWDSTP
jgi:hypothetical protein